MNCPNCNTPNDAGARFCKNCGGGLAYKPVATPAGLGNDITYLLVLLGWELFSYLTWFVVGRIIVPHALRNDNLSNNAVADLYRGTGWTLDIISLLMLIVFSVLVKSNTARIFLVVFAVLRLGMMLATRVFNVGEY